MGNPYRNLSASAGAKAKNLHLFLWFIYFSLLHFFLMHCMFVYITHSMRSARTYTFVLLCRCVYVPLRCLEALQDP